MNHLLKSLIDKWPEYLIEAFVIILSILGAFQLQNWNENAKALMFVDFKQADKLIIALSELTGKTYDELTDGEYAIPEKPLQDFSQFERPIKTRKKNKVKKQKRQKKIERRKNLAEENKYKRETEKLRRDAEKMSDKGITIRNPK